MSLDQLIRIPAGPLPAAKEAPLVVEEVALEGAHGFVKELLQQQRAALDGMKIALAEMADAITADPAAHLAGWSERIELQDLIAEVAALPTEAGEGHMKVRGHVPARIDSRSSRKYAALILVHATRALFLAERRGIQSIQSSVDARASQFLAHLSQHSGAVLSGFLTLSSVLQSPQLSRDFHTFATRVLEQFEPEARSYVALCTTYELLASCAAGDSSHEGG